MFSIDTIEYSGGAAEVIRSGRRTVSVEIRPDGSVLVRAPRGMSQERLRALLGERAAWIERHRRTALARREAAARAGALTDRELDELAAGAREDLPARVRRFASLVGTDYGRVTIRRQRTRWGSCSGRGDLSFNCLLMLAPEAVRDYVVVHELCHRLVMDHSPRFWAQVERVLPRWRDSRQWLRREGAVLMARLDSAPPEGYTEDHK